MSLVKISRAGIPYASIVEYINTAKALAIISGILLSVAIVVEAQARQLDELIDEFDQNQIMRIQDNSSKTRLSILFYSFMWNSQRIARQTLLLLKVFKDPLAHRLDDKWGRLSP